MKADFLFKVAAAAIIAGALSIGAAQADKPSWAGHGHGNGNSHEVSDEGNGKGDDQGENEEHHHGKHHHDEVKLVEHDRVVIREYIGHHRDKWCPPGLAKKHNGCMPPGQLKYKVGETIPTTVHYTLVPRTVVRTWAPLPPDEIYVRTGGDVYVMDKTSRTILDAVTLMNDLH
jgi:hypothetical protein